MAWQIVIAGGGFGGFYAARTLERVLPHHSARVTLVNNVNYMLYSPLLPGAAAGTLESRHVVVPLREALHHTEVRLGRITGIDRERKTLQLEQGELRYDHLILALGSTSRTLPVPGLAEYGHAFKDLPDAIALRNRLLQLLEHAEASDDRAARRADLTFVFVGAGYAGLEGLAELQDFAADVLDLYPRARATGMRWILVEAAPRVMGEIAPGLAEFATRELRGRGIEVLTGTTLEGLTANSARLSTGETVPTRMVVWTAGVKPNPLIAKLGLPLDQGGRIRVDRAMRVEGADGIWAIGDGAAVPDPAQRLRAPCPPTAQHAIRQGRRVARNVGAAVGNGRVRPFRYRTLGVFVDLGRHKAVATTVGIRWRGFFAWFLARSYHLAMMPGLARKTRLLIDWNIGLFFGRDTSELGQLGHATGLPPAEDARAGGEAEHAPAPEASAVDGNGGAGARGRSSEAGDAR
jgi:NADH dehydrogenase